MANTVHTDYKDIVAYTIISRKWIQPKIIQIAIYEYTYIYIYVLKRSLFSYKIHM